MVRDTVVSERLVPVRLPPDTALLTALFECDSARQVVLREVDELRGRTLETNLAFARGRLDYRTTVKRDTLYLPARDSTVYVARPVETSANRLSWQQEAWIRTGKVLAAALIILLFIKFNFKKKGD